MKSNKSAWAAIAIISAIVSLAMAYRMDKGCEIECACVLVLSVMTFILTLTYKLTK